MFPFSAFAAEQKEILRVKDSLCCYAYNPEPPHEIKPLFIGDSVSANWYVYLPDLSSRLVLVKENETKEVAFKESGIYNVVGSKAKVRASEKSLIRQKGESCQDVKFNAERMLASKDSPEGSLELDDPQRVPSPSS